MDPLDHTERGGSPVGFRSARSRGEGRRPSIARSLAMTLLLGCGLTRGVPTPRPNPAATEARGPLQEATTHDPSGIRVLWHGPTRGALDDDGAWVASSPAELRELWGELGREPPAPAIDFTRFVAFGAVAPGGACPREITGARLERGSVLRLLGRPLVTTCPDVLTRVAQLVAVPRSLVPADVTFVPLDWPEAFRFRVARPSTPAGPVAPRPRSAPPPGASLGRVALPERGHLRLARLSDGSEIWVVHQRDGTIDVLSSSVAVRGANFMGTEPYFHVTPAWREESGRFLGGYDARGRNVHGWTPLPARTFERRTAQTLDVYGSVSVAPGPIQPERLAPVLEGQTSPYRDRTPVAWDAIPIGRTELLGADVVWGTSGPARLCTAPRKPLPPLRRGFAGCKPHAPAVAGSPSSERNAVSVLEGPVVVRRLGPNRALVVLHRPASTYGFAPSANR